MLSEHEHSHRRSNTAILAGYTECRLLAQRVRCRGASECQLSGELRKSMALTRNGADDRMGHFFMVGFSA